MPPEGQQSWREILTVSAALRTGLLEALRTPARADEAAERASLDPRAVGVVARSLCELGYLESDGDTLRLAPLAAGVLDDAHGEAGAELLLGERAIRDHLALDAVLRGEPRADDISQGSLPERRRFMAAMRHISAPRAPQTAAALAPSRPGARLLDVGGAPGTYGSAFDEAGWEVTVFDLAETLEVVADDLAARGLRRIAGDLTRELPRGPWDAIYLGNVLHLFGAAEARAIVARAAERLAEGGALAIQEMMLGRAPQAVGFGVLMLVATEDGDVHSAQDYRDWVGAAGLRPEPVIDLDGGEHQLLIARAVPA